MCEGGGRGIGGQREPQLSPRVGARARQAAQRGAQHVLGDEQATARLDDQAIGPDGAVRHVRALGVQGGQRVGCIGDQRKQEVGRQARAAPFGQAQDVGQADAVAAHRDEGQAAARLGQAVDAADTREAGMIEVAQLAGARAQRELEVGHA